MMRAAEYTEDRLRMVVFKKIAMALPAQSSGTSSETSGAGGSGDSTGSDSTHGTDVAQH